MTPYLQLCLARAEEIARKLHALEVTLEHVLLAILADEDSGAHRLIVHAFADPPTLYAEVMALSPGILVVGSGRSLPFSVGGVRAVYAAHAVAAEREASAVDALDVLTGAVAHMHDDPRAALRNAGLDDATLRPVPSDSARAPEGSPFAQFDSDAKRALGRACRAAIELGREAISPAHLVLGALASGANAGTTATRARIALSGSDADEEPLPALPIARDTGLVHFLAGLGAQAGSVGVLDRTLREGREELRLLLVQQRITTELVDRSGSAFDDPEGPEA